MLQSGAWKCLKKQIYCITQIVIILWTKWLITITQASRRLGISILMSALSEINLENHKMNMQYVHRLEQTITENNRDKYSINYIVLKRV